MLFLGPSAWWGCWPPACAHVSIVHVVPLQCRGHWLMGVQTSSFTNVCCKGNCQSPMCASTIIREIQFLKQLHCLRRAWAESTLGFLSRGQEATFVSVSELMLIHPKAGEGNVYKTFTVVATHSHLPGTCAVLTGGGAEPPPAAPKQPQVWPLRGPRAWVSSAFPGCRAQGCRVRGVDWGGSPACSLRWGWGLDTGTWAGPELGDAACICEARLSRGSHL